VAVHVTAAGRLGQPLSLEFRDSDGHAVRVSTPSALDVAQKRPMDESVLGKALGKTLGGGTFGLAGLDVGGLDLQAGLYVAPAEIKVRRTTFAIRAAHRRTHLNEREKYGDGQFDVYVRRIGFFFLGGGFSQQIFPFQSTFPVSPSNPKVTNPELRINPTTHHLVAVYAGFAEVLRT
jgi:hypothetical protein